MSSAERALFATAHAGVALSSSGSVNIAMDTCTDFIDGIICKGDVRLQAGVFTGRRGKYGPIVR
jgi:hypothetical protein